MEEEFFDIVDEMDRVVDRAKREDVHRSGQLHRSTHLLVFDNSGRVLLQKRSPEKDTFPGRWDSSVSGHVDSGEGYDQCIVREAKEEIGIELTGRPEKLFKIDACEETAEEFTWVYRTLSDGPFLANEQEISEIRWFAIEEVDRQLVTRNESFSPAFALVWERMREDGHLER
jgi:isopentenyl-diphosphate delta-isomerase type 1|tara:strand:+ start:801 stop:1316 length:516 start_codon:yes stop_codon:yes gene_type:complete